MRGAELDNYFSILTANSQKWDINRSKSKNDQTSISNLIFCAGITSSTIGLAIRNKIRHVIAINRFDPIEKMYTENDILELIYKNDLFVLSLGSTWIFNTSYGKKLLNIVLNNPNSSIWNTKLNVNNIFIGFESSLHLEHIFFRLRNCVYYFPPKFNVLTNKISSILIVEGSVPQLKFQEKPDLILTMNVNSALTSYCYYNRIVLVFIHADILFFEIARELSYLLTNSFKISTILSAPAEFKIILK